MTTKYLDGTGLRYFRDTYVLTETQVNTLIQTALSQFKQDVFTVVSVLPQTGNEGIAYTYGWKPLSQVDVSPDLTNYYTKTEVDGLLTGKASSTHVHGNITNDGKLATGNRVVITDSQGSINTSSVSDTELGYLSGTTSNIQTQLNSKHDDTNHVPLTPTEIDQIMV